MTPPAAAPGPASALAAVFQRDGGTVSGERAGALSAALHPFGAHADVWRGGPAALVRRTARTPAARAPGDRASVAAREGSPLLFDGFLAAREELAAALGLAPGEADRQPDGALFARAWTRWGADAAARVGGEFAFVAWDGPARTLVAACSPWTAPPGLLDRSRPGRRRPARRGRGTRPWRSNPGRQRSGPGPGDAGQQFGRRPALDDPVADLRQRLTEAVAKL